MTFPRDPPLLVCAGEFYTDLIFFDLDGLPAPGEEVKTDKFAVSPGGGAAITAATAALLERPVELVTVWGKSMFEEVEDYERLKEVGVACGWSRTRSGAISGLTVAASTREDRCFLTYPGANRFLEEHLLDAQTLEWLGSAGHVHFALTPSKWMPFLDAVQELQYGGVTVSWDLGWDPAAGRSHGFRHLCRKLDLIFLNEMEALKYAGASSVQEALDCFSHKRNTVVIKLGAKGAVACKNAARPVYVEGIEVEAVDSTGAGDAFNGGFLHEWMAGDVMEGALITANACGGLSTRSPGGIEALPTKQELERRLIEDTVEANRRRRLLRK